MDFTACIDCRTAENRWLCAPSPIQFFMSVFLCDSTPRLRLWTSEQGILQGTLSKKRQVEYLQHRRLATSQPPREALEPEAELHPERWNSTTALLGEVCHRIISTISRISLQHVAYNSLGAKVKSRLSGRMIVTWCKSGFKRDEIAILIFWYFKRAKTAFFTYKIQEKFELN